MALVSQPAVAGCPWYITMLIGDSQQNLVCCMGGQRGNHRSVSCVAGEILISTVEGTPPCGRLLRSGICM